MAIKLIYSERFLEYEEKGHPESPGRLRSIKDFLDKKNGFFEFIQPTACKEKDLLLAHSEELVKKVRENDFYDPDTPNISGIYKYAVLSCGAAIQAAYAVEDGGICISLGRPPGHHAGRNTLGGFCYFNNMAVAVKKMLSEKTVRIAVVDIDGHHGNGTEEILKGEESVIYLSLHQGSSFPGTGRTSFGNAYNFPVLPGASAMDYMEKFSMALEIIKEFSPDMIGVSAGFDAHRFDPLLSLELEDRDFYKMGKEIALISQSVFAVMEGGYNIKTIGNTFFSFANGLARGSE